jgi:hypothetical protein
MNFKKSLSALMLIAFVCPCFAGTTSVYFGRNTGSGCTGSGVCQLGATVAGGVTVTFSYVANDGKGNNVLTMSFNFGQGQESGFSIESGATTYTFNGGYTFANATIAQQCGVPVGYSISDGTVAAYYAPTPASGGNCGLVITKPNK